MPETVCIGMGSNVGGRTATLQHAVQMINDIDGCAVLSQSDWIETQPVGPVEQRLFRNGAIVVETDLEPEVLLDHLLRIERANGRDRSREQRWGPRTLDLDILLFGDRVLKTTTLTIPHPRMHERGFVLEPLAEIGAALRHPIRGESVGELWGRLVQSERDAISGAGSGLE